MFIYWRNNVGCWQVYNQAFSNCEKSPVFKGKYDTSYIENRTLFKVNLYRYSEKLELIIRKNDG